MKAMMAGLLLFVLGCGQAMPPPPPVQPPVNGTITTAIPSGEADKHIGKTVAVRVDRGYCSYQTRTRGQPTFCNDARYPGHKFTMLVWGSDRGRWNPAPESWDGKCFHVKGMVTSYQGKPQIEAKEPSQVSPC